MDSLKRIEKLFERVRLCGTPVFHVSDQVMAEIAERQCVRLMPLSIMAGISAAAAAIALFYAIHSWESLTWSLTDYFDPTVLDVLL
jgi:hypothetical protein